MFPNSKYQHSIYALKLRGLFLVEGAGDLAGERVLLLCLASKMAYGYRWGLERGQQVKQGQPESTVIGNETEGLRGSKYLYICSRWRTAGVRPGRSWRWRWPLATISTAFIEIGLIIFLRPVSKSSICLAMSGVLSVSSASRSP